MRRVVITGMGMVTPLGTGTRENWENVLSGRSGVGPIRSFDASHLPVRFAGEVRDFDPLRVLPPRDVKKYDRFILLGLAAADEALADSGLSQGDPELAERAGVVFGSGMGGLGMILQSNAVLQSRGPDRVSPFFVPGSIINMAAGLLAIRYGFLGPNYATVSACSSSAHAVADAFYILARGEADVMLAGGSEALVHELALAGFASARALSQRNEDPERASRPFSLDRDGFVLAEGAAVLVLEEREHALRRGAHIYAELLGAGMSSDAYHITAPPADGAGAARAMRAALRHAGVQPEEVQYINAHATGTPLGDAAEVAAIKAVFGGHAYRLAVSSTKSMTGHLLGAAGAVELAYTVLAVEHQILPPTINREVPDPECDLDVVPEGARPSRVEVALSNSFGFGGSNVCLVVRRHTP